GVVRNRIGYFGSWSGGGVHVVSLTNASAPLLLTRIDSSLGGFNQVHTVFLERNFLYEAAHVAGINFVKVIDVSNPSAPFFVRDIISTNASKVHQITAIKKATSTILYTSDFGNGGTSPGETDIWDVSDVGNQPALWLGRVVSGSSSHSSWPTPDGNTLVVCRETAGGDVRLYDISNPASPSLQATISPATMGLPPAIPHNPVIGSNLLFLSWYQNGLQVFDIADRTKPVRIGSYDTYPAASSGSFQGNWGIFPHLGLNKLLLSDIQSGLYVLDATAILTATNNYPPLLVTQPSSVTATQGFAATLSAEVTGSSPKFQWRFNNVAIPGATNRSLVYNSVQSSNSGNYFVIATNSLGSVTSSVAALTVVVAQDLLPTITGQPQSASVYPESSVVFSVALSGAGPFAYQWRFNGGNISGATNDTWNVANVQPEFVGNYSVFVTNSYGTALSSNAALTLIDSPYLNSVQATAGARSALVSWRSTVPSDSQVQFAAADAIVPGPSAVSAQAASFDRSSFIDRRLVTNHTLLLTGLTPGTRYSFQVISRSDTNVFPSGVYQFVTAGSPIILDNTNSAVTFAGTWGTSVNVSGFYGSNYRFANNADALATATFAPSISTAGKYDVYAWYTAGSDRSSNAPFAISYSGGSNTFRVNQKINGGAWNRVASGLPFTNGNSGFVRLSNRASNTVVIADAVQFLYAESQDSPNDNSVPAWWENFYFGGPINPLVDHDGDGFTTAEEYILGTSPIDPESRLMLDLQASGASANVTFWPLQGNRNYQLLFRANLDDATWQAVSPGNINPTPYGHGIFSLSTGNMSGGFYRLQVQLTQQGNFSGSLAIPLDRAISAFGEAACGANRIYAR
ncbi:MAG: immunoglobulin domain-containing protein, partial [Verrucomicrobiota bacterium]